MKRLKIIKITGLVLGLVVLSIAGLFSYKYHNIKEAYNTDDKPFKKYIGYIDQDKALLNDKYKLCYEGQLYHTYSSAALKAYSGSKKQFRDAITADFNTNNYSDSGYLNFRFLVNCEGKAGWFETIQMNLDLEETTLKKEMVDELFQFTSNPKHWNIIEYNEAPQNYYMYISYRIENGKVTEIIP